MVEGFYPTCGKCKTGILLPVNLSVGSEQGVRYRCTNNDCKARFDEHGYELYDEEAQEWKRLNRE
jgi:hypothetical protein